ncbi:MAG: hypothetical protein EHM79_00250 [Geobacter sp.]|nr:MAG: hypothetical protein EHM79_00250 [Geobacter sp.]
MTIEDRRILILAQICSAYAEIEGMKAENADHAMMDKFPLYTEEAFFAIPEKYGITHNQVISYLMDGR